MGGELQREDDGCGREKMVSETMSCEEKRVNVQREGGERRGEDSEYQRENGEWDSELHREHGGCGREKKKSGGEKTICGREKKKGFQREREFERF